MSKQFKISLAIFVTFFTIFLITTLITNTPLFIGIASFILLMQLVISYNRFEKAKHS